MPYSNSVDFRGVCGNFRFKIYGITDAATTNSVVKTDMRQVFFVSSTNTTDNADNFKAQVLNWTGTADSNTANELVDSSEIFVNQLTDLIVYATSGDNDGDGSIIEFKDADELNLNTLGAPATAQDLFPAGTETYIINDERHIVLTPVTGDDDGTLIILGQ